MHGIDAERFKKQSEKIYNQVCENIRDNDEIFAAMYKRIVYQHDSFDPPIDKRIKEMYNELPAKERLEMKLNAEYDEFMSYWRGLNNDELIDQAEKIAIVNKLHTGLISSVTDEMAEYFLQFCEPLEAISDQVILNDNHAHEWSLMGQVIQTMYENGDGGAYYDMEDEYYAEAEALSGQTEGMGGM